MNTDVLTITSIVLTFLVAIIAIYAAISSTKRSISLKKIKEKLYDIHEQDEKSIKTDRFYSFIYLNEYKMYSISSQMFKGLTDHIISYKSDKHKKREQQKSSIGTGGKLANIIAEEMGETEKKFLHDYSYMLFENELEDSNKISKFRGIIEEEKINNMPSNMFVKITGKAEFLDYQVIRETIKNFNKIGESLFYSQLSTMGEDGLKILKNKQLALSQMTKQGLHLDEKSLEHMVRILEYGYSDQFEVRIPLKTDGENLYFFNSLIDRNFLRESEKNLATKYSRETEMDITILGIVTQSGETHKMNSETESSEPDNLKKALFKMFKALSNVENTFTGRLDNEIIIDPVAIYRQV